MKAGRGEGSWPRVAQPLPPPAVLRRYPLAGVHWPLGSRGFPTLAASHFSFWFDLASTSDHPHSREVARARAEGVHSGRLVRCANTRYRVPGTNASTVPTVSFFLTSPFQTC